MVFLTQLLGASVARSDGAPFGKIADVVVGGQAAPSPKVEAYVIAAREGERVLPAAEMMGLPNLLDLYLARPAGEIAPYKATGDDLFLARDVLDEQVVDVRRCRVVKANDIELAADAGGGLVATRIDPGMAALARRLGREGLAELGRKLRIAHDDEPVAWDDAELLPVVLAGQAPRRGPRYDRLACLDPADIGDLLGQIDPAYRISLLESMENEAAAEAIAAADEAVQVSILQQLGKERAADLLEQMPPDEAADVLGDMNRAHREELLGLMEDDDRKSVEKLLPFDDRTAGGMMTNEYVAVKASDTAADVLERLRRSDEAETIYYVYVVDEGQYPLGVVSLRELLLANPADRMDRLMNGHVRTIDAAASVSDVARMFERYGLLALPVVDDHGRLQGIVTVDDTLEQILPKNWRRRSPRGAD